MTHSAQLALSLETHRNHYLFADHFLTHVLPSDPSWSAVDGSEVLAVLAPLWAAFEPDGTNEAQVEEGWVRPVLRSLGHVFNVQVSMKTPLGSMTPDYLLYSDESARAAAPSTGLASESEFSGALAIGDAKAWAKRLDQPLTARQQSVGLKTSDNPSYQIDAYVRYSGLQWGILTNGRHWRLVHRDTSKRLDVYYEVDLPALIEQAVAATQSSTSTPSARAALDALKYFWLFFRAAAFTTADGPAWLDGVLTDSRTYAQGISESLKEQVYEALGVLAQGFYDMPSNRLETDEATLKAVYDNSLIVLYRLLFVLYAEDRGILPVASNSMYRDGYSLQSRKRQVALDIDRGLPAGDGMDELWLGLKRVWRYIDAGQPELMIPAYDGGLFDGARHPLLETHSVGDRALRRAIDLVARTDDKRGGGRQSVDYRDLEVRHLGSIYEGLLEYRLRFAEVDLAVTRDKGREVYAPADEDDAVEVIAGRVYLTTDKGERKATGSYYTPDYIVQYIVEQTVGPVLSDLTEQHMGDGTARGRSGAAATAGSTAMVATTASTTAAGSTRSTAGGRGKGRLRAADGGKANLADAILSVNILDPAMGSGHFLVAATEHVARHMVGLALDVPPDLGDEGELAYWRRRIVQACIYGVDVNPLAVELAKLSLWLATVARDRPLSFLDHHLRTGNSLVGARVADVPLGKPPRKQSSRRAKAVAAAEAAGQLSMTTDSAFAGAMVTANGLMAEIEAMRSDTVEDVHAAEALFRDQVRVQTAKARSVADVWTARHFGLAIDEGTWPEFVTHILHGGIGLPQWTAALNEAARIAAERRFFHWELEFPEVFFDRFGRLDEWSSGFDAVIGNPPYVRQEVLGDLKPFLATSLPDVYHGTADIFVYFIGQGLGLLSADRRLSYVASNSWMRANYAGALRNHLRTECTVEAIVDLGDNRVFADAPDVYPAIIVIRNAQPQIENYVAEASTFTRGEGIGDFGRQVAAKRIQVAIHDQSDSGWQVGDDTSRKLLAKLMAGGTALGEVVEGRIYYGIKTGLNEAFIIDTATRDRLVLEDARSTEIIRPIFRGQDLRPWYQKDEGRSIIVVPNGWTSAAFGAGLSEVAAWAAFGDRYRAVAGWLQPFADAARRRQDKGKYWWELRACDYYDAFDSSKLVWPDIAKSPRFSLSDDGSVLGNTAYFCPIDDNDALWSMTSRCLWFALMQIGQPLGERAGQMRYRLFHQYMATLPIPDAPTPTRTALADLATRISSEAKSRYALHQRARRRITADLGVPDISLNQKLTAWWTLDFPAFRAEVNKVYRRDIDLRERDDWDSWLGEQRAAHQGHTAEIVRLETELNAIVYGLFDLTAAEVRVVEESTKYRYGEV